MPEKVSVVIPAKNRLDFTTQAIRSVKNQKGIVSGDVDIIVIDDGSDSPLKPVLLDKFQTGVRVFRNKKPKGPGGSRNIGLKYAKGDYIAFLDSDDRWKPNFLAKSLMKLKKTGSPATTCLTDPYFYGKFPLYNKTKLIILNLIKGVVLILSFVCNRRQLPLSGFYLCQISHMLFKAKGIKGFRFNEKTAAAEDWEFIVDVTARNTIEIIPEFLVDFRYEIKSNSFSPIVRREKEMAYTNLLSKLSGKFRQGILYPFFKWYLKYFLVK
jgi:glycosyltransferase involved in cell wall biosynthesis